MLISAVLAEVATELERRGVPFALAGGIAVGLHGVPRFTEDIDLVVDADRADDAVAAMSALGFRSIRRLAGFSNHVRDEAEGERVDLLFVHGATRDEIFARLGSTSAEGREIPLVHADHLVAMKLFAVKQNSARQFQDLQDVRDLVACGAVDKSTALRYLERYGLLEHASALGLA